MHLSDVLLCAVLFWAMLIHIACSGSMRMCFTVGVCVRVVWMVNVGDVQCAALKSNSNSHSIRSTEYDLMVKPYSITLSAQRTEAVSRKG